MLDPEDAREARLRLGVLASTLLEDSHELCVIVSLADDPETAKRLQTNARDFLALADAMAVLDRLRRPVG